MSDHDDVDAYIRQRREAHGLAVLHRRAALYQACLGMPARAQASKDEMALWLVRYAPDRIETIKRVEPR